MVRFNSPLDHISIASPCSADWNEMYGDERRRFCGDCRLNVYNLSGMTRGEAEAFIVNAEGRVCVRLYRRRDGSVITKDCPVGLAKVRRRVRAIATAAISLVITLFTGVFFVSMFSKRSGGVGRFDLPWPPPKYEPLMGAVALPPRDVEMGKIASRPPAR